VATKGPQFVQKAQPKLPESLPPDAVEQRPQPSAQKNQLCMDLTAGKASAFFGVPQSANQGDAYGLASSYDQAATGEASM
jgi:hypothetical protein